MIKTGDIFKYKAGRQFPWTVIKVEDGIVHFKKTDPSTCINERYAFKQMKECFVLEKMNLIK